MNLRCQGGLKPNFYQLHRPWSPWASSIFKTHLVEPGIEPGTSWLVVRSSDHQATRLVKHQNIGLYIYIYPVRNKFFPWGALLHVVSHFICSGVIKRPLSQFPQRTSCLCLTVKGLLMESVKSLKDSPPPGHLLE